MTQFQATNKLASWNCKKQKAPGKYKRELHEMQAVDQQKLPRQCITSVPHRLPTQSHHIEKSKHAGGLQPMLLTPRHIKLACILCGYALALEAGPRR